MKKLFICASVVGLAAGVVYLLCKKEKSNNTASKSVDKKVKSEHGYQEEEISQNSNVVAEMHQAKSESAQAVNERHSEAGEIMKEAYCNIMEDFIDDFSGEKVVKEKEETKEAIIDSESVSVIKALDSISDELDDLLK